MSHIGVTLTGADDAVDPEDLVKLTEEFPFVEWGILSSTSRRGTPRYPSLKWIGRVVKKFPLRLSMHLCGQWARQTAQGIFPPEIEVVDRLQVNGYEPSYLVGLRVLSRRRPESPTVILQTRTLEQFEEACEAAAACKMDVLFDPSGGTGARAASWPKAPEGVYCGYAGGIGPDNVRDVISEVVNLSGPSVAPFWIDMESGVRENDAFSVARARAVLEEVRACNLHLHGWRDLSSVDATKRSGDALDEAAEGHRQYLDHQSEKLGKVERERDELRQACGRYARLLIEMGAGTRGGGIGGQMVTYFKCALCTKDQVAASTSHAHLCKDCLRELLEHARLKEG